MTIRNLFHQKPRTAFVLGGGGNLGAVQVGQLKALISNGIVPDVVVGCSVGALNGAAIAGEPTLAEIERLEELWRRLSREDIFPSTRLGRGPWMFVRNGLSAFSDHGLQQVIDNWMRYRLFEEAKVPFWAVATCLRTGREHWFHSGDVRRPLLASTALPGVFPPVSIDGHTYIDGGVVNNVPMSKAFELKAKRVYVLDVGSLEKERREPKRPYEVLMHAVSIARASRLRLDQENVPEGVQMIRMPGIDAGKLRYDNFGRSAELIEKSYRASMGFLTQVHAQIA